MATSLIKLLPLALLAWAAWTILSGCRLNVF
jgi:hypothetical protein